jgi:hypothetical protein
MQRFMKVGFRHKRIHPRLNSRKAVAGAEIGRFEHFNALFHIVIIAVGAIFVNRRGVGYAGGVNWGNPSPALARVIHRAIVAPPSS